MRRFSKYVLIGSSLLAAVLSACGGGSSSTSDGGGADTDTDTDTDVDTDSDTDTDTDTGEPTCWWDPMETGTSALLGHVWGLSSSEVYTGGLDYSQKKGLVQLYDGVEWGTRWSFDDRSIGSVWGTDENDLFVVMSIHEWDGDDVIQIGGTIAHWDGASFTDTCDFGAWDLFGFSSNALYAAGLKVRYYDGMEWSLIYDQGNLPGEPEGSVHAVWGAAPDDVWFVGGKGDYDGFIMHYDGEEFEEIPTTADLLNDIHGVSADEIYAVGNDYGGYEATVLKYDGNAWSTIGFFDDPEKYNALSGVWAAGNGEVFAVGWLSIHHFDSENWTSIDAPASGDIVTKIWGTDLNHLFIVGGADDGVSTILKYTCPE